jgi:protein phosphatase
VFATAQEKPEVAGMGTTLVALLAGGGRLALAHVGDSRAYLVRGGRIRQLTDDHSLVAELVRRRELSPDAAQGHPHRHVLTRAVGVRRAVDPDLAELTPAPERRDRACARTGSPRTCRTPRSPRASPRRPISTRACARLVGLANARGGDDNITVALVRCDDH